MLTLPFFATQASIVFELEPVAAHASVAPAAPRTSAPASPISFFFIGVRPLSPPATIL
jgi:hypothetical protein